MVALAHRLPCCGAARPHAPPPDVAWCRCRWCPPFARIALKTAGNNTLHVRDCKLAAALALKGSQLHVACGLVRRRV